MKNLWLGIGVVFGMLLASPLMADSWLPPSTESYESADGNWKLTIYPRNLTSALDYFQDQMDGNAHPGGVPGDAQKSPIGHMERRQGGSWQTVWKAPLANDVSPVQALVSKSGIAVTLDNWHSVGWGDDAVVIYAPDGRQVRQFGLSAFLPGEYVDSLPRSVSSIHWRGEPKIDESRQHLVIPVVVPTAEQQESGRGNARYLDVRFLLADGALVPMSGTAWVDALGSAAKADARRRELDAERTRRFISPLTAPKDGGVRDWRDYLVDAYFRLDPDSDNGYPVTRVVPLPDARDFKLLSGYLGDDLSDDANSDGVIMMAALSQDVLVEVVRRQAKRATPNLLADARIYVAADNAHMAAISAALARTGATVIQLDIDAEIPQRKERLERYLRDREGAEE